MSQKNRKGAFSTRFIKVVQESLRADSPCEIYVLGEEHPALWNRSTMSEITRQLHSRVFDERGVMDAGPGRRKPWRIVSSNPDIVRLGRSCCHDHQHVDGLDTLYLPEI